MQHHEAVRHEIQSCTNPEGFVNGKHEEHVHVKPYFLLHACGVRVCRIRLPVQCRPRCQLTVQSPTLYGCRVCSHTSGAYIQLLLQGDLKRTYFPLRHDLFQPFQGRHRFSIHGVTK